MAKYNNGDWHDPGHIDYWEDMLPEERQYEKNHRVRGRNGLSGSMVFAILLMIYWIVDLLVSCSH